MPNLYGATGSRTAQGRPGSTSIDVPVLVDKRGRVITVPGASYQSPSGLVRPRADNDGTQVVTSHLTVVRVTVPGIGIAAAYTTGYAFGTKFGLEVPTEGTIATVVFHDYDKEGLTKEIWLFSQDFVGTADNSAFAPTDAEVAFCVGVISIGTFYSADVNMVGVATPALYYIASTGHLYGQMVTRGADNIAGGNIPDFTMAVT